MYVGDAISVARAVAGTVAVIVAPVLMIVGSSDITGTVGATKDVPVAESPDPPATVWGGGWSVYSTLSNPAMATALKPSAAARDFVREKAIAPWYPRLSTRSTGYGAV